MTTYIYALVDPNTNEVRYIGKSVNPERRLNGHLYQAKRYTTPKSRAWLRGLLQQNLQPRILILQKCDGNGCAQEIFHISLARYIRLPLVNDTDGGEGLSGWKPTSETRAKMSNSSKRANAPRRGVPRTPEVIAKIKATKTAHGPYRREFTPEMRALLDAARAKRKFGPEMRAKMSASAKARCARDPSVMHERGKKSIRKAIEAARAQEAKAKRLTSRKSYRYPQEVREKIAASLRGRKQSPERIAKHSAMMKERWAKKRAAAATEPTLFQN